MRWWRAAIGLLMLGTLVAVMALGAYVYPRDDVVPSDADAVVVLGGSGADRAALGIELAERHDLPLVLSSSASIFGEQQGRSCGEDTICIQPDPANTAGEARTTARLADEQGWDHVVVATSRFHTSRSRMLFRQCLGDDKVTAIGSTTPDRPGTTPGLMLRESLGILGGLTLARAC